MDISRRVQLTEDPEDEELPDYDYQTAPEYDESGFGIPIVTYHLRQANRRLQMLVPFGPLATTSYTINHRAALSLFSKKPHVSLALVSQESKTEITVASIRYVNNGPLPWCPRASIRQGRNNISMESRNFSDWRMHTDGIDFVWQLKGRPITLILNEQNSNMAIARFTYSERGTTASSGGEVGKLEVFRDNLSSGRDGIETIICSLLVAVEHFKRMGRHYWNDGSLLGASLARSQLSQLPPQTGAYGSFAYM